MEPSASPVSAPTGAPVDLSGKISHLPTEARVAYQQFRATGDAAVLDPLIFAILQNYAPRKPQRPYADHPGTALLVEDLGFDSLAITEVVFFTEDLFGITIANEEIIQVRTLDDLRAFICAKVVARAA